MSSALPLALTIVATMLGVVGLEVTGLTGIVMAGLEGIMDRAGAIAAGGFVFPLDPTVVQPAAGCS